MAINYYTDTREDTLDAAEYQLYELIMDYRASLGLRDIPLSESLTIVAGRHAVDQIYNLGYYAGHRWSDDPADDSANFKAYTNEWMWRAPERLDTAYRGNGFEISVGSGGPIDPQGALNSWINSQGHNDVITNQGVWSNYDWNAIGIGIHGNIAHVWFGAESDPWGAPVIEGVAQPGVRYGTSGNDLFVRKGGNETIEAGYGLDTYGAQDDWTSFGYSRQGERVQLEYFGDVITLNDVERLIFDDRSVYLDTGEGENAGMAFRIYQAAFDRDPDSAGLSFWIDRMDAGASLEFVAANVMRSTEFVSLYGRDLSNRDFVDNLYFNILDRAGEDAGLVFWTDRLDRGVVSRAEVLAGFSESGENITTVAASIENGFFLEA